MDKTFSLEEYSCGVGGEPVLQVHPSPLALPSSFSKVSLGFFFFFNGGLIGFWELEVVS